VKPAVAVIALFAFFSVAFLRGEEAAGRKPVTVPPMNFKHSTLPNGLEVYAVEDHSTPIVAVQVWYHVGSKDDPNGRSGFAHLF
jgi:zinc protease